MPFMVLPIALVLAALCAVINVWLGLRVARARKQHGVWVGDGGVEGVVRRLRAQANFVENAPFVLALVALIELCAGTSVWLAILAGVFVLARIAHPFGMDGWRPGRTIGAVGTLVLTVILALWAIAIPIAAYHAAAHAQPVDVIVPVG